MTKQADAEPETLDDLLADVPDLSTAEADEALRTAEQVETVADLIANLDDAEEQLKELLAEVRALRKRARKVAKAEEAAEG